MLLKLGWTLGEPGTVFLNVIIHFRALAGEPLVPGIIGAVQAFGDRINFHSHPHLLVSEGERSMAPPGPKK